MRKVIVILLKGYGLLLLFTLIFFGVNMDISPFSYLFILLANIYMLYESRNNYLMFIVSFVMLYSDYSIIYANYINRIDDTIYTDVISPNTSLISLNILFVFVYFLLILIKWSNIRNISGKNLFTDKKMYNSVILFILSGLLVLVFFIGFKVPEEEGQRGSPSSLYEYAVVLFILFFYYCGEKRKFRYIGLFFVLFYSFQNFMFGGRIYGLQFLMCAYIMLFMHKLSMFKTTFIFSILFVFFSIIGYVRGNLLSMDFDLSTIFVRIGERGFALDTAYSAYFASETFVYIADKYTIGERLAFFGDFLQSIIMGSNLKPDSVLQVISSEYVHHTGGGLSPFYFYFYLGSMGVIIPAAIIALYFNKISKINIKTSGYIKCLGVYLVSVVFRWYLYSPMELFRGVMFYSIAYYVFAYIHLYTRKKYDYGIILSRRKK